MYYPKLAKHKDTEQAQYGFSLCEGAASFCFMCESKEDAHVWYSRLKRVAILSSLDSDYTIGEMIGKGTYAKVHVARQRKNGSEYAIKSLLKGKLISNPRSLVILCKIEEDREDW